jgi:hypothetical protein
MTTPAWDDLDAFVDTDDFAVAATVTLQGGQTRTVNGIYEGPYVKAILGRDTEYDTERPTFHCKASDVAGIQRGDGIAIPGQGNFGVLTHPQPDGNGMAVLELAPE